MSQNKALSTQEVADILHVSKSTIYELIKRGEINSYKIGRKVRFTQDDVDAYIARSRHEHSTQPIKRVGVSSSLMHPGDDLGSTFIISGQDVVLDILANHLHFKGIRAGRSYLSSFEGLLALYEGRVSAASCHLYSWEDGQYNIPYVKMLMPGVSAVLINVSYRTQGFYVKSGNPKGICGWDDLKRGDISILNRRIGSSPRILLDGQLKCMGVPAAKLTGYGREMKSHLTMAAAIAEGEADIGIGTERISRQMEGIDFIPLMEERYDLVLRREIFESAPVQTMLDIMRTASFNREIARFSGNDYRDIGKIIAEV